MSRQPPSRHTPPQPDHSEAVIADVSVPYESRQEALNNARAEKAQKYKLRPPSLDVIAGGIQHCQCSCFFRWLTGPSKQHLPQGTGDLHQALFQIVWDRGHRGEACLLRDTSRHAPGAFQQASCEPGRISTILAGLLLLLLTHCSPIKQPVMEWRFSNKSALFGNNPSHYYLPYALSKPDLVTFPGINVLVGNKLGDKLG